MGLYFRHFMKMVLGGCFSLVGLKVPFLLLHPSVGQHFSKVSWGIPTEFQGLGTRLLRQDIHMEGAYLGSYVPSLDQNSPSWLSVGSR